MFSHIYISVHGKYEIIVALCLILKPGAVWNLYICLYVFVDLIDAFIETFVQEISWSFEWVLESLFFN